MTEHSHPYSECPACREARSPDPEVHLLGIVHKIPAAEFCSPSDTSDWGKLLSRVALLEKKIAALEERS